MTYNLTKQEFNEAIMMYIRDTLSNQAKLLQEIEVNGDEYEDDMWLYFIDMLYRKGVKAIKVPVFLSVMRDSGISSQRDWSSLRQRFLEEKLVHLKNNQSKLLQVIYLFYWRIYMFYRKCRFYMKNIIFFGLSRNICF